VKLYKNRRIRCSGYRHTRETLFAEDGDILVSFLSLDRVSSLPLETVGIFFDHLPDSEQSNELKTIEVFPPKATTTDVMHVRVGTAVTSREVRQYAVEDGWSLPVDVTSDE